jgi:hypothetical protein
VLGARLVRFWLAGGIGLKNTDSSVIFHNPKS